MSEPSGSPTLKNIKPLLLPAAVIYAMVIIVMPDFGHDWDTACWWMWASQLKEQGIVSAYDEHSTINYLPLFPYILKLYSMFLDYSQLASHIHYLKAITWLFDTASILLLCSMLNTESKRINYFIYGLLNVGFFYNTLIWNQVDGILSFFLFASFWCGWQKKQLLSVLLFVMALNFKLQGIVFAPVLAVFWLSDISIKKAAVRLLAVVVLQTVILLPFLINGNVKFMLKVAFGSVDYFSFVSLNAFNIWHLLIDGNLRYMPDNTEFVLGMTHKSFGLLMFVIAMLFICAPLYYKLLKKRLKGEVLQLNLYLMLMAMALTGYVFYFFNTQMHERYIHPVLIFITALAFIYRHWVVWLLVSIAYALSLEFVCRYFALNNYNTLIFHPKFMASLFAIGLVILAVKWVKLVKLFVFEKH